MSLEEQVAALRGALVVQGQALNLALSTLIALAHGDGVDDLARHQLEKSASDFRAFVEKLRGGQ